MHALAHRLLLVALIAALAPACGGGARRLADGSWYGKIVSVDVAQRTLRFAPACRFSESGRWIAVPDSSRVPAAVRLSTHADLEIYYRPNGNVAEGHGQSADLKQIADVALRGRLPDSPPGWFVTVRDRAAVSVEEDSRVRSSGKADRRTFACVWSRSTQAFVGSKHAGSRVSFVIGARSLAGLPISPDTSYRRVLRYFARAGQHGSSSFPDGLCRLRFEKIGLSTSFITLAEGAATPAKCRFGIEAVVTGSRWHTANGLHVGAPLA